MKIVPAPDIYDWIKNKWDRQTFEWDIFNTEKLKKHGFSKSEVEEMFLGFFFFAGEVVSDDEWKERRYLAYSKLDTKYATIVWTIRKSKKMRIISCRRSRENEKKDYKEAYNKRS